MEGLVIVDRINIVSCQFPVLAADLTDQELLHAFTREVSICVVNMVKSSFAIDFSDQLVGRAHFFFFKPGGIPSLSDCRHILFQHILIKVFPLHSRTRGIGTTVRTGYGIHDLLSFLLKPGIGLRLAAIHRCVPHICGPAECHIIDSSVSGRQLTILFQ